MNAEPVVPEKFKQQWGAVMDRWGDLMLSSVATVAEMIASGFSLPKNALTDLMQAGYVSLLYRHYLAYLYYFRPHLLAPTGSDLTKFGSLDTVFAGFHYDFNLLTIHGKSRFPGLFIWLRDGSKIQVKVN